MVQVLFTKACLCEDDLMRAGVQSYSGLQFDNPILKMFPTNFDSIPIKILGSKLIKLTSTQTFWLLLLVLICTCTNELFFFFKW